MIAHLGFPRTSIVYLQQETGYGLGPKLGVTYNDANVWVSKAGAAFVAKILSAENWVELGDGYYAVSWSEDDLNTLGEFFYRVEYTDQPEQVTGSFYVVPPPLNVEGDPPTCLVTGNIVDVGGDPNLYQRITFRPKKVPVVAGMSLVSSGWIQTATDAFGNFSVKLLRSSEVIVEINGAGIKQLIIIPDAPSASLLDLLPPIPPVP